MTIRLWDFLEDLNLLVGADFPEADEDALMRCRDAWADAAAQLRRLGGAATAAGADVAAGLGGVSGAAFAERWQPYSADADGVAGQLASACDQLAAACDRAASEVEYAKVQYIAALVSLAATLAALTAALVAGGVSALGMPVAVAATSCTVRLVLVRLVAAVAMSAAMNLAMDGVAQAIQMLRAHRDTWDWEKTRRAAVDGALVGLGGGGVLLAAGRFAPGLLRHPAGLPAVWGTTGALSGVAIPLSHGEMPTQRDLLLATTSGMAGGIGTDMTQGRVPPAELPRLDVPSLDVARLDAASLDVAQGVFGLDMAWRDGDRPDVMRRDPSPSIPLDHLSRLDMLDPTYIDIRNGAVGSGADPASVAGLGLVRAVDVGVGADRVVAMDPHHPSPPHTISRDASPPDVTAVTAPEASPDARSRDGSPLADRWSRAGAALFDDHAVGGTRPLHDLVTSVRGADSSGAAGLGGQPVDAAAPGSSSHPATSSHRGVAVTPAIAAVGLGPASLVSADTATHTPAVRSGWSGPDTTGRPQAGQPATEVEEVSGLADSSAGPADDLDGWDGRRPATDPQAIALAREHVVTTPAGVAFYEAADTTRDFARMVRPTDGYLTVDLHGSPRGFQIGEYLLSPAQFADALADLFASGMASLPDGFGIKLVSCDTAVGGPHSPAAELARRLGVPVVAPDQPVWTNLAGDEVVASPVLVNGNFVPADPPDGSWQEFLPPVPAATSVSPVDQPQLSGDRWVADRGGAWPRAPDTAVVSGQTRG